jgi:FkbM family methyltransferase
VTAETMQLSAVDSETLDVLLMVSDSAWKAKDWTAARRAYALVLSHQDYNVEALNRMGRLCLMAKEYDAAIDHFSEAFILEHSAVTAINLGVAYARKKDFVQALHYCADALLIEPGFLPAYVHMAALYEEMGQLDDSEAIVGRGLELHPNEPQLLYAQGLHNLACGNYADGWQGYEYRINRLDLCAKLDEYAEWQGESLAGKTILVAWEQGFGDQIMWARYLPMLAESATNVVLFTRPDLARLMSRLPVRIVTTDAEVADLEPDYWVAMGSLPIQFAKYECSPYLSAEPNDVRRFRSIIPADGSLRVGICWRGNPDHYRDEYRSMAWEQMQPLLDIPGCTFYSLQYGDKESPLPHLLDYCHDWADNAAAIACLDLVITVDTGIAHLAGAMGKPVWILLGKPSDWRWGIGGPATPWYPTARLFRGQAVNMAVGELRYQLREESRGGPNELQRTPKAPHLPMAYKTGTMNEVMAVERGNLTQTADCRYGRMTWLRNDHYVGRSLALYGEYSQAEADLLRKVLKPGDVAIEAGANVGGLTVALADIVGEKGKVFAFEPEPAYFNRLDANTFRYGNVFLVRACLSSAEGSFSSRAVPAGKVHAPGWNTNGDEYSTDVSLIDAGQYGRVDLLKVDVDGQEHEILKGAEQTIDRCRPLIYVEHDRPERYPDMLPWLAAKGYRLYQHEAPLYSPNNFRGNRVNVFGSIVSLMVLAVPNERKDIHPGAWGLKRIYVERAG